MEPVPGAASLAVRDAVINPGLLPEMSPEDDQELPDAAELWRRVESGQLTAWGGLVLNAAVACGARGDRTQAEEYLSVARAGAARAGSDRHDYWVSFGPSHVGVQTTHIMTALNRPDAALKASGDVQRGDLLPVQWGRHRLNDARALLELRKSDAAEEAAAEAKAVSVEWFRHQGFARSVVDDLVDHRQRLSAPLRDLVSAFEE
ncbi:hypothetical protein ACIBO2_15410 [Nonomuraea sp. NPDC050022]|uniref:hypothetical protein n=1 Tax=unclassified Nonomuraea TaxID=2593643 RepID=UPI0033F415D8